jgi:hypothetical protein
MYQNSQGVREPWIKWTSDYFSGSGWNPLTRCREVSDRLETYRRNRQLKYVTWGRMNNQNVICTALNEGDPCVGLIYTLKPYQNPRQTLDHFFAWREGQAGLPSLYESAGKPRLYIDVRARLEEVAETVTQPNTPDDSQPTIPQPSQDQSGQREL